MHKLEKLPRSENSCFVQNLNFFKQVEKCLQKWKEFCLSKSWLFQTSWKMSPEVKRKLFVKILIFLKSWKMPPEVKIYSFVKILTLSKKLRNVPNFSDVCEWWNRVSSLSTSQPSGAGWEESLRSILAFGSVYFVSA